MKLKSEIYFVLKLLLPASRTQWKSYKENKNEIYIYVILEINFKYILVLIIVKCRTSIF